MTKETIAEFSEKNFIEIAERNPCTGCSAPCCRVLLIPHKPPATFLELDYIRYMLGFKNVEMIVNSEGQWHVYLKETCQLLDEKTNLCTVHNTSRKPKVCDYYNPYQCWYQRNLTTENPPDTILIDREGIERILPHVKFDNDGNIKEVPNWEKMRELLNNDKSGIV